MTDHLPPDCLLTLIVPSALEEDLLDLLRGHAHLAPGFTLTAGYGMGQGIELASAMEQVQGRARQVLVQLALPRQHLPALLEVLHRALPTPHIHYWAAPLLACGRLGAQP